MLKKISTININVKAKNDNNEMIIMKGKGTNPSPLHTGETSC